MFRDKNGVTFGSANNSPLIQTDYKQIDFLIMCRGSLGWVDYMSTITHLIAALQISSLLLFSFLRQIAEQLNSFSHIGEL